MVTRKEQHHGYDEISCQRRSGTRMNVYRASALDRDLLGLDLADEREETI
jgi:hypothetical protein